MKPIEATIVFLQQGNNVWLAKKTRKVGKGFFNGYGGKVESGECPLGSTMREVYVETGGVVILPNDIQEVGEVLFHNFDVNHVEVSTFRCFIHLVKRWDGEPVSTEEMKDPQLFFTDRLPFDQMMPADREWIPEVFSGKRFKAVVCQDLTSNKLLSIEIEQYEE